MAHNGKAAFFDYYQDLFKSDAQNILAALSSNYPPSLLYHPANQSQLQSLWQQSSLSWVPVPFYPFAVYWPSEFPLGASLPGYDKHIIYPLSSSSLLPISALSLQPDDIVLDACAAPGGKSLAIANRLSSPSQLQSNEYSRARFNKLTSILNLYNFTSVAITSIPAQVFFKFSTQKFSKILVDAPCSSEAHVLKSPKHLGQWSPNRVADLHFRQIAIVSSLLRSLKVGGLLVYSTCAINFQENEGVVAKILKKYGDQVSLVPIPQITHFTSPGLSTSNLTFDSELVRRVWPHLHQQSAMFVAAFTKINEII